MKAVIPAAGLGTRFLPATKAQAKEMLPVYDKPTIQYVVEEAVESGVDDILIITGKGKRSIEDHFDRSFELEHHLKRNNKERFLQEVKDISDLADIHFIRQKKQLGLGDAIYCAKKHIQDEPFVVMLGDSITKGKNPCTKQLIDVYKKYGKSAIAVEEVPDEKVERYGIIGGSIVEENVYKVDQLIEKPPLKVAPSNLAIMGRYFLTPDIFDHIEEVEPGYGGEIQLTDALAKLDEIYAKVYVGESYDIGNRIDWLKTSLKFAMEDDDARDSILEFINNEIFE